LISEYAPDAILIAAGSKPAALGALPGADRARHASDAYFYPDEIVGEKITIIGGGLIGVETGIHLSNIGREVTVLEAMDEVARDANLVHRRRLAMLIPEYRLDIRTGVRVLDVAGDGVEYEKGGERHLVSADQTLYAVGMRADHEIFMRLYDRAETVLEIGDSRKPGKIEGAVHSGFFAAMDIGSICGII
jgi:pyruvate/2-oxoglutarate dehydrogenase complex dihydrolipoamide dehydrogenase (E3) component